MWRDVVAFDVDVLMIAVGLPEEQGALRFLSTWGTQNINLEISLYPLCIDRIMGERKMLGHNQPLIQLDVSRNSPVVVGEASLA